MAHVISFKTAKFDPSKEKANPIKPIAGLGVLEWIRAALKVTAYTATMPDAGDAGWYMDVRRDKASYKVKVSGRPEAGSAEVKWTVQIHSHRSFLDKLRGRNHMPTDDALAAIILTLIRKDDAIKAVHTKMNAK